MTSHLSATEIAYYLRGSLRDAELLRVDDHLDACEACRAQLDAWEQVAPGVATLRASIASDSAVVEHPTHEQIEAYADGTLDEINRHHVAAHVRECVTCAEDVSDLAEVAVTVLAPARQRPRKHLWPAVAAGLAAAAGLAGLLVWSNQSSRPVSPGTTQGRDTGAGQSPAGTVAPGSTRIQDGERVVTLDAAGNLTGIPALDPDDRGAIVAALQTGVLPIPAAVVALHGRPGTLMSEARTIPFRPVRPVGTAVVGTQPAFEWTPLPDATSYVVSVFDPDLNRVAESPQLHDTRWSPDRPLSRGQTYVWQVRARARGTEALAPSPPQPEARFRVLAEDAATRVAALRERYAASPLALGVLLAREGVIDEAQREIQSVADANRTSSVLQQLLSAAQERRTSVGR